MNFEIKLSLLMLALIFISKILNLELLIKKSFNYLFG